MPEQDQRAIAARLALAGTRHALLDDVAAKVGIDQPAFGPLHGIAKSRIGLPLFPCETLEPAILENARDGGSPAWPLIYNTWRYISMPDDHGRTCRKRLGCRQSARPCPLSCALVQDDTAWGRGGQTGLWEKLAMSRESEWGQVHPAASSHRKSANVASCLLRLPPFLPP